jgi:hypothetical protein
MHRSKVLSLFDHLVGAHKQRAGPVGSSALAVIEL